MPTLPKLPPDYCTHRAEAPTTSSLSETASLNTSIAKQHPINDLLGTIFIVFVQVQWLWDQKFLELSYTTTQKSKFLDGPQFPLVPKSNRQGIYHFLGGCIKPPRKCVSLGFPLGLQENIQLFLSVVVNHQGKHHFLDYCCKLPRKTLFNTTTQILLRSVYQMPSEAGGLVARLGYSRQRSRASNRLG